MFNMKKGAFIIPYFGKFNNYFQLFLNSCKYNSDYDWIIFTDDRTRYDYPPNVKVHYTTFESIKKFIQAKFDFKIALNYPYKFCDLKPMYGYIFSDYLKKYPFWGHCDVDLIFGNINEFITDNILNKYDRIGILGHFTLYKNSPKVNEAFKLRLSGKERYKEVLSTGHNFSFDEEYNQSINNILVHYGFKIYKQVHEAGLYTKTSNFRLNHVRPDWNYDVEPKTKNIFVWNEGFLTRYILNNNFVNKEDYLYIHFQSRPMKLNTKNYGCFKIIPNSFDDLETKNITPSNFPKWKHFNLHYFRLRTHNLIHKVENKLQKSGKKYG